MKSCLNDIPEAINDYLVLTLQEVIDSSDLTRGGIIKIGLLQDDPTQRNINILTYSNDPDSNDAWMDELVSMNSDGNPPGYFIGGGEMWWRRFSTALELFYKPSVKRDDARKLTGIIASRAEKAIAQAPIDTGPDDFGETPLQIRVMKSHRAQGGGEGQFIWHVRIFWQVLTGKDL